MKLCWDFQVYPGSICDEGVLQVQRVSGSVVLESQVWQEPKSRVLFRANWRVGLELAGCHMSFAALLVLYFVIVVDVTFQVANEASCL